MSQSLLKSESAPLCRMPGSLQDESVLSLDLNKHGEHGQTGYASSREAVEVCLLLH